MEQGLGVDDTSRNSADGRNHGRHDALGTDDVSFHWATKPRSRTDVKFWRVQADSQPARADRPTNSDVCVADLVQTISARVLPFGISSLTELILADVMAHFPGNTGALPTFTRFLAAIRMNVQADSTRSICRTANSWRRQFFQDIAHGVKFFDLFDFVPSYSG